MLAQADVSLLDLIPGARSAVNYVISKVAEFQRVPQRLAAVQVNLVNAKRAAEAKGNMGLASEAAFALQTAIGFQNSYPKVAGLVGNAMDQLRQAGMLAGTLDVAGAVLDAASKVAAMLNGTKALESSAVNITNKAQVPMVAPDTGGGVSKYLLFGGLLYIGLWALRKGRGTRRW